MANKKRRCLGCKDYFPPDSGFKAPVGFFHSSECAYSYSTKKAAKKTQKDDRAKLKTDKDKIKTIGQRISDVQASVNRYIRARDLGKPCISCGEIRAQKRGGTVDAGHYRSRGAAGHLRFNLFNIHGQCVTCNRFNSGNVVDYRIRLIERIGIDRVERLENDNRPRKFTHEYLKRMKRIFSKRALIIEKIRGNKTA